MVERQRAGIFESEETDTPKPDFDISGFAPKKPADSEAPPVEAVRAVSERAKFVSRDPAPAKKLRRRRTGRNLPLNLKVDATTRDLLYEITDQQGYERLGETLERALAALQRELARKQE